MYGAPIAPIRSGGNRYLTRVHQAIAAEILLDDRDDSVVRPTANYRCMFEVDYERIDTVLTATFT
jgi:hypothetical protein